MATPVLVVHGHGRGDDSRGAGPRCGAPHVVSVRRISALAARAMDGVGGGGHKRVDRAGQSLGPICCCVDCCGLGNRFGQAYETPTFGITAVADNGRTIPLVEQVALAHPFCRLLRFAQSHARIASGSLASPRRTSSLPPLWREAGGSCASRLEAANELFRATLRPAGIGQERLVAAPLEAYFGANDQRFRGNVISSPVSAGR